MIITFFVEGQPVAKARPRVTRRGVYTPDKTKGWQERVTVAGRMAATQLEPPEGPISMRLDFRMAMPKSWTKAKRQAKRGSMHMQKPDLDNLVKAVTDALNGICYWDDAQVAEVVAMKIWEDHSMPPGVEVELRSLE